ncbi:hypothetical protein SDC9_205672 [bioreactor metagenome]|uniref:Uncharacterized protein n=1 Tax=bioreactor metagenome TaxID=1076179 RepID=A0A645J3G1_9ZZZZ
MPIGILAVCDDLVVAVKHHLDGTVADAVGHDAVARLICHTDKLIKDLVGQGLNADCFRVVGILAAKQCRAGTQRAVNKQLQGADLHKVVILCAFIFFDELGESRGI